MREIKFRAWDKDDKVMRSWKEVQIQKDYGEDFYFLGYKENKAITRFDHEQILMQYTGLKDKNGKEIYEGDIVKITEFFNEKEPYLSYQVTFGRGVLALLDEDELSYVQYPLYDWIENTEVIGNVYENPEILEVEE